jgi:F0F1-type ATP synthase assembly protein I
MSEALSNLDLQSGRRQALAVVLGQALLGAVVVIACLAGWGTRAAASAATGAGIGIAATALMAFAMLRHGEGASAERVTLSFVTGWLVKVGFTVATLVLALRSPGVDAVPMLVGYFATFAAYFVGAVRAGGQETKRELGRSG